jgi:hypothetical protein
MANYVPILSYEKIVEEARKCLEHAHPSGHIPVPIEDIIDVGFGIDIVPTPNLETHFETIAFITKDLREIRVDDYVFRRQPSRLRFSLAHELAHVVLHESVYNSLFFTTPAEWKTAFGLMNSSDYKRMELQADSFAGLILVPPAQFREQFRKINITLEEHKTSFKQLSQDSQSYAVNSLARIFSVSTGTIWFRLRAENFM